MNTIDASIPLQAGQGVQPSQQMDLGKMLSLAKIAEAMKQKSAIKNVFAQPGNMDNGQLTQQGISQLYQVDPEEAIALQDAQAQRDLREQQIKDAQFKRQRGYVDAISEEAAPLWQKYDGLLKSGIKPEEAATIMQEDWTAARDRLKGLPQEVLSSIPERFDPAKLQQSVTLADKLRLQDAERKDAKDQRDERRINLSERKEDVTERRLAASEGNRGDPNAAGWQILTDPSNKDESGAPVQYRYNTRTAQATTLDGKPYTPGGAAKVSSGAAKDDSYGSPVQATITGPDGQPQQVLAQQNKKTGQWVSADEKRTPIQGVTKTDTASTAAPPPGDPNVEETARAIAHYQMAPLQGFVMRSPYGQSVMARALQLNPDYQATEFGSRSKAVKDFATGKQGQMIQSFNTSIAHLNTMQRLADALQNHDIQGINRLSNYWKEQTGEEAPTNFDTAKAIVGDEIIKAIVGSGGALADRENAQNQISRAKSPEQLAGVIGTYKELMAGQLRSLKKTYETTTGLKNFDERLFDDTKEELGNLDRGKKPAGQNAAKSAAVPPAYKDKPDGTVLYDGKGFAYRKKGDQLELIE